MLCNKHGAYLHSRSLPHLEAPFHPTIIPQQVKVSTSYFLIGCYKLDYVANVIFLTASITDHLTNVANVTAKATEPREPRREYQCRLHGLMTAGCGFFLLISMGMRSFSGDGKSRRDKEKFKRVAMTMTTGP